MEKCYRAFVVWENSRLLCAMYTLAFDHVYAVFLTARDIATTAQEAQNRGCTGCISGGHDRWPGLVDAMKFL